jgi:hypothetical protein
MNPRCFEHRRFVLVLPPRGLGQRSYGLVLFGELSSSLIIVIYRSFALWHFLCYFVGPVELESPRFIAGQEYTEARQFLVHFITSRFVIFMYSSLSIAD